MYETVLIRGELFFFDSLATIFTAHMLRHDPGTAVLKRFLRGKLCFCGQVARLSAEAGALRDAARASRELREGQVNP